MTELNNDTQPTFRRVSLEVAEDQGVDAPPRFLLWGMILLFVLVIGGIVGGIFAFRDVLRPSQQERVMEMAPFMRAFKNPTPAGGILPTPLPDVASADASSLLTMPLVMPTTIATVASIAATATPLPTQTPLPTLAATAIPTTAPTLAPTAVSAQMMPTAESVNVALSLPSAERIVGFRHEQQTWNNCGPATITMAMTYFGWTRDQEYAKDLLRPNREDKNVTPAELVNFVNTQSQLKAIARMGGTTDILKALIANRFPVMIERGIMFEAYDWVGHYQLLVAYDNSQGNFYAYDSFMGTGAAEQGVPVSYQTLNEDWKAFNRQFIVIYNPADEALLQSILGDLYDPQLAAQASFDVAQAEAKADRADAFAWFNMGSALTQLGRYPEAARAFDQARRLDLPWRMLWYQFGPFEAYFNEQRYDDVVSLAQANLNNASELEETYYWRGRVYAAQGDSGRARADFQQALAYNGTFQAASDALTSLN